MMKGNIWTQTCEAASQFDWQPRGIGRSPIEFGAAVLGLANLASECRGTKSLRNHNLLDLPNNLRPWESPLMSPWDLSALARCWAWTITLEVRSPSIEIQQPMGLIQLWRQV